MPSKDRAARTAATRKWQLENPLSPEERSYRAAKYRCNCTTHHAYARYGGRGIEFRFTSFQDFLNHIGEKPTPKHQLDRINNDGHYEIGNVRWVTPGQNSRNTRKNKSITYNGKTLLQCEWARELGIKHSTLKYRFQAGWTVERALSTPAKSNSGNSDAQVGACG